MDTQPGAHPPESHRLRFEEEVVEVSVLLPAWQVEVLAEAADRSGLSVGRLVRLLTREYLLSRGFWRECD